VSDVTEIPRGNYGDPGPCWIHREYGGQVVKPTIVCNCGKVCNIGLHHVHADGTVTRSFFDSAKPTFVEGGKTYSHTPGCGWHVWLKLKDYGDGEFAPMP